MSTHWTDEQILDRLYGLAEDDGHLAECASCRARWEQAALRRPVLQSVDPEPAFLALQRRQIYDHVESGRGHFSLKMVSAMAAAGALAMALIVYSPAPPARKPAQIQISDAQLHSDIYLMMASSEPKAAEPVRELFEK